MENRVNRMVDPASWILLLSFVVSFVSLIIYLIDINFSDKTLLLLLDVMRYSSSMLFICAFYKIILNIYRSIRDHKLHLLILLLDLLLIVYCFVVILMNEFIITFSGGNL
ncbi:hypothetical protein [Treponema sp. R80B11-R83G3]